MSFQEYIANIVSKFELYNVHVKKTQSGGKLLGEGGYGCVVSPPLKCNKPFFKIPYSIDEKYVSKIFEYDEDDEDVFNELKIGNKLISIDPYQKYFSPIINGCNFIKQKHPDIQYLISKPDYDNTSSTNKKSDKCSIFNNVEYLNLISKNAGIDFDVALRSKNSDIINFIRANYISIFKHLCTAVELLHKNSILHRDIKTLNSMIDYKKDRQKASISIIDFGLSISMDKKFKFTDLYNLTYFGTDYYKPLEIIIINYMIKVLKKNKYQEPIDFKRQVLKRVFDNYKYIAKDIEQDFYFTQNGFKYNGNLLDKNIKSSNYQRYGNKNLINHLYNYLYKDYINQKLLTNLTNVQDKHNYIYKWDVFSLGLMFAEIIVKAKINDEKAFKLVNNMVNPLYFNRYTIKECLDDPFFKNRNVYNYSPSIESISKTKISKHKFIDSKSKKTKKNIVLRELIA
jgi:serine/threonine protein kinase